MFDNQNVVGLLRRSAEPRLVIKPLLHAGKLRGGDAAGVWQMYVAIHPHPAHQAEHALRHYISRPPLAARIFSAPSHSSVATSTRIPHSIGIT